MGRITIFTLEDCPYCKRVTNALEKYNIPYTEINISEYPYKRNDLMALLNRTAGTSLTIPQVFFNDTSVGGAEETLQRIAEWERTADGDVWDMYEQTIVQEPDPIDVYLDPPTSSSSTTKTIIDESPPRDKEYSILLPNGTVTTVLNMTEDLLTMLQPYRKSRTYATTIYKKCFTGSDAVEVFQNYYNISESQAIQFGIQLQNSFLLTHVTEDHIFDKKEYFYRLRYEQQPWILNSYRVWTERVDPDGMRLIRKLKSMLGKIQLDQTDIDTGKINYKDAYTHDLYPTFEEAICELQTIDYAGMDGETKMAFSINLYNMMIVYAFMKVGIATTDLARSQFYTQVKFQIGGFELSFQDLENGILRGNRKAPHGIWKPFSSSRGDNARLSLSLLPDDVDCRIHFGLNCGAVSCPPVKNFTAEGIHEELRVVAQAFCQDDANVRLKGSTLYLSKIFDWYMVDFVGPKGQKSDLPRVILEFLVWDKKDAVQAAMETHKKRGLKLVFNSYDWSAHASDFLPFNTSILKSTEHRIIDSALKRVSRISIR